MSDKVCLPRGCLLLVLIFAVAGCASQHRRRHVEAAEAGSDFVSADAQAAANNGDGTDAEANEEELDTDPSRPDADGPDGDELPPDPAQLDAGGLGPDSSGEPDSGLADAAGEPEAGESDARGPDSGGSGELIAARLVAAYNDTCLLAEDGHITCWGEHARVANAAAAGKRFRRLSAAGALGCGVTVHGELICWGEPGPLFEGGEWLDVATDRFGGCALGAAGNVRCWGLNYAGYDRSVPSGATRIFVQVDRIADFATACVLSAAGRPHCWQWSQVTDGLEDRSDTWKTGRVLEMTYPCARYDDDSVDCRGDFMELPKTEIAALRRDFRGGPCVVRSDGSASCANGPGTIPSGALADLAMGQNHICGLRKDGKVACTFSYPSLQSLQDSVPDEQGFVNLTVGAAGACAERVGGELVCFAGLESLKPPVQRLAQLSIGAFQVCGLDSAGHAVCMGESPSATPVPAQFADVSFQALSAADAATCGVATAPAGLAGRVLCWGKPDLLQGPRTTWSFVPSPGRSYQQVSLGHNRTICMTDDQSTLSCGAPLGVWAAQPPQSHPASTFRAGSEAVCALPMGGGPLTCAGPTNYLTDAPSDRNFVSFALGYTAGACGTYANGTFACWGAESLRRGPPSNQTSFVKLGVGAYYACGLDSAGAITCWGKEDAGQAEPPPALR